VEDSSTTSGGRSSKIVLENYQAQSDRSGSSFLRSRFIRMFRSLKAVRRTYGVKKGRKLSNRHLTDTIASLKAGKEPKRAFMKKTDSDIPCVSAFVSIDHSGSMYHIEKEAANLALTLTEPLDALNDTTTARVRVEGWMSGSSSNIYDVMSALNRQAPHLDTSGRHSPIQAIVYKTETQPLRTVARNFGRIRSGGGTPMTSGLSRAFKWLSKEDPNNVRVCFLLTDGAPNDRQAARRMIDKMTHNGIIVVGVGFGYGASSVKELFPIAVWGEDILSVPKEVVAILEPLILNRNK
jgi:hypothetical protein